MTGVPYERDGVPRPVLRVTVTDPRQSSSVDLLTRIDTGFDGGLLIPLDKYVGLRLQQYEEPSSSFVARLAPGASVSLRSSKGVARVGGRHFEVGVYTTPLLLRPLLGRELLNLLRVTLDGPRSELKISNEERDAV